MSISFGCVLNSIGIYFFCLVCFGFDLGVKMASSKASSKTILDLKEAYDEGRKKRYTKGKFLGKVS